MSAHSVQTDIAIATLVVAAVVLAFGIIAGRQSTTAPRGVRTLWEMSIETVDRAAGQLPAAAQRRVTGTAITLFWFVAVANWLHLIPGSPLPAPTSDINLTLALAVTAMGVVHLTALQVRGLRGYLHHYVSPWWLAPAKLLEEAVKPLTLALRLFGMVFASALMIVLIGEILPAPVAVIPHVLWTLFDVFIGAIQAFIFALLTVLYFQAVLPVVDADGIDGRRSSRPAGGARSTGPGHVSRQPLPAAGMPGGNIPPADSTRVPSVPAGGRLHERRR